MSENTRVNGVTPRVINAREMLAAIKQEASYRGSDFVYRDLYGSTCAYVVNPIMALRPNAPDQAGEPGCILGGAMMRYLDLPQEAMLEGVFDLTVHEIEETADVRFTVAAVAVAQAAQTVQDSGQNHGLAYEVASRVADVLRGTKVDR